MKKNLSYAIGGNINTPEPTIKTIENCRKGKTDFRVIERDSVEWTSVWENLIAALKVTPLPTPAGINEFCSVSGFMLMGVDGSGKVHFKDIETRNYLYLLPDGIIEIPTGANWHNGLFHSGEKS